MILLAKDVISAHCVTATCTTNVTFMVVMCGFVAIILGLHAPRFADVMCRFLLFAEKHLQIHNRRGATVSVVTRLRLSLPCLKVLTLSVAVRATTSVHLQYSVVPNQLFSVLLFCAIVVAAVLVTIGCSGSPPASLLVLLK